MTSSDPQAVSESDVCHCWARVLHSRYMRLVPGAKQGLQGMGGGSFEMKPTAWGVRAQRPGAVRRCQVVLADWCLPGLARGRGRGRGRAAAVKLGGWGCLASIPYESDAAWGISQQGPKNFWGQSLAF